MKSAPDMKMKSSTHGFASVLLLCAALVPLANAAGDATVHTTGGVSYVSGGIGVESIDRLNALAAQFNVKLVFALNSGAYVNGVQVAIIDAAGKSILKTLSEGPWLLARLPVGNYRIVATLSGQAQERQIAVGAAKLSTVDFRWASE
jgi:hypothetical protein